MQGVNAKCEVCVFIFSVYTGVEKRDENYK